MVNQNNNEARIAFSARFFFVLFFLFLARRLTAERGKIDKISKRISLEGWDRTWSSASSPSQAEHVGSLHEAGLYDYVT